MIMLTMRFLFVISSLCSIAMLAQPQAGMRRAQQREEERKGWGGEGRGRKEGREVGRELG